MEVKRRVVLYTDGGCSGNPGPMGSGVVAIVPGTANPILAAFPEGHGTNNIAEYMGLIRGLDIIDKYNFKDVLILSDSNLMVKQVNKIYNCKDKNLKALLHKVNIKLEEFKNKGYNIIIDYTPREFNPADAQAKKGVKLN